MLILVLTSVFSQVMCSSKCMWKDERGYEYNLAKLDKTGGWQVKDETSGMGMFSMVYIFNFCDFSSVKCHDKEVGAIEALAVMGQITDNCDVAGLIETQKISHLDESNEEKGILISYGLGDLCMDPKQQPQGTMQPRQAQFEIECGSDEYEFQVVPESECVDKFRIRHSVGCRNGGGSHWFLTLLILIICYFGGRFIYNRKVKGIEGNEAIPHIEFIRNLEGKQEIVVVMIKSIFEKVQGLVKAQRGYDRV